MALGEGEAVASACPMVWVVTTPVLHPMSKTGHEVTVKTVVVVPVGPLEVALVAWDSRKVSLARCYQTETEGGNGFYSP